MHKIGLLVLTLALSGCVNYGAQRRAFLSALIGQPETAAVQALGVPTRTYETGGVKFLAYDQRRLQAIPIGPFVGGYGWWGGGYGGFYDPYPTEIVERSCETTLEVAGGRVRSWSLRGTLCG